MKLLKFVRSIIRIAEIFLIAVTVLGVLVDGICLFDPFMLERNGELRLAAFAKLGITVDDIKLYEIITMVSGLPTMLISVAEFRNIRLILDSAIAGKPFVSSTVRSLRWIGCCVIVETLMGELVYSAYIYLCGYNTPVPNTISISGFVTGLLILCLAQAFAYGVQLQQDSDGLL